MGLSGLTFLGGCECVYTYRFEMRNTTGSAIEVSYSANDRDSVTMVEGETPVVLCMPEGGVNPCWANNDSRDIPQEDVDVLLNAVRVRRVDGAFSSRDYLSNGSWFYSDGVFRAYVTDAEFE